MRILLSNPWVQLALTLIGITLFCAVCYLLSSVLVPLFFAFLVAYVFDPVIDWIETHGLKRMTAIMVLMTILLFLLLMAPLYVLPDIITQADRLIAAAQSPRAPDLFDRFLDYLPLENLAHMLGWVPPDVTEFNAREVIVSNVGELIRNNATDFLRAHAQQLVTTGTSTAATAAGILALVASRAVAIAAFIGNLALFAFVAIYLLKDYDAIVAECDRLTPPRYRSATRRFFSQIDVQLRAWLRGQGFVCLCMGVMYTIGFVIAGLPFAILLGIFGGLVSFVPFLGVALTSGPAIIIALVSYGLDWRLGVVMGTFLLAQFLEGNFITPRVMGSSVGLSPVWVILAIVVFGSTFGFGGLLLAVPLAAVLKVIVSELTHLYRHSRLFLGSPVLPEGGSETPAIVTGGTEPIEEVSPPTPEISTENSTALS